MSHNNLHIIEDKSFAEIASHPILDGNNCHFTNGTYQYDPALIVPTMLAGFQYIKDTELKTGDIFVLAVNSDLSMKNAGFIDAQDQMTRAKKVAEPLALQNPDVKIVVVFYDEETPTNLYNGLAYNGISMATLHKWGYGTNPNAPKIEGAHNFRRVFGFPLPNNTKPVFYDLTAREDQSSLVKVVDLTKSIGNHFKSYITKAGKVLFKVPDLLLSHKSASNIFDKIRVSYLLRGLSP